MRHETLERVRTKILGGQLLGHYVSFLVRHIYQHAPTIEGQTVLEQVVCSIALAILILAFLRLLARLRVRGVLFVSLAGPFAVAGFPVVALRFPFCFLQGLAYENRFAIASPWLWCELALALTCAIIYHVRKLPLPAVTGILLLILHFGFWSWLTGTHASPVREAGAYGSMGLAFLISMMFYWGFPVLGFLAALMWGLCTRESAGNRASASIRAKT